MIIEIIHNIERKIAIGEGITDDDIVEIINTFYLELEEEMYSNKLNMVSIASFLNNLKEVTIHIEQKEHFRKQYKIVFFVLYYTLLFVLSKSQTVVAELEQTTEPNNNKVKSVIDTYNYYFTLVTNLSVDWTKETVNFGLRKSLKKLLSAHKYISYSDFMAVLNKYQPEDYSKLVCDSLLEKIESIISKEKQKLIEYSGNIADVCAIKNNGEYLIKVFGSEMDSDVNQSINAYLLNLQIPIMKEQKVKEHLFILLKDEELKTLFKRKFFDWVQMQKLNNFKGNEREKAVLRIALGTLDEFENNHIEEFYYLGK